MTRNHTILYFSGLKPLPKSHRRQAVDCSFLSSPKLLHEMALHILSLPQQATE
jgi:hypothetical protein